MLKKLSTIAYNASYEGPICFQPQKFTLKPTNQGCALHVPALLGMYYKPTGNYFLIAIGVTLCIVSNVSRQLSLLYQHDVFYNILMHYTTTPQYHPPKNPQEMIWLNDSVVHS